MNPCVFGHVSSGLAMLASVWCKNGFLQKDILKQLEMEVEEALPEPMDGIVPQQHGSNAPKNGLLSKMWADGSRSGLPTPPQREN